MPDKKQAPKYTDAQLTKVLQDNAYKLPYAYRKHVDISGLKAVLRSTPLTKQEEAAGTVADVPQGSRDTVEIRDPDKFLAHPYQITAHEVGGHIIQNGLSPEEYAKFQPVNADDPYNFGGSAGIQQLADSGQDPRSKLSVESFAEALQYKAAHDAGGEISHSDLQPGDSPTGMPTPESRQKWGAMAPAYQALEDSVSKWKMMPQATSPITGDDDPRLNHLQIPVPDGPTLPPAPLGTVLGTGAFHAQNTYAYGDPAPGDPKPAASGWTVEPPAPAQAASAQAAPSTGGWSVEPPAPAPKPAAQPGVLSKIWSTVNTPITHFLPGGDAENAKLQQIQTGTPTNADVDLYSKHPAEWWARNYLAGVEQRASDMLTPLFVGTLGASKAASAIQAAPEVAPAVKTAVTAAGKGVAGLFAGQGAQQIYKGVTDKNATGDARMRSILMGAGMLAGGAHEVAGPWTVVPPEGTPTTSEPTVAGQSSPAITHPAVADKITSVVPGLEPSAEEVQTHALNLQKSNSIPGFEEQSPEARQELARVDLKRTDAQAAATMHQLDQTGDPQLQMVAQKMLAQSSPRVQEWVKQLSTPDIAAPPPEVSNVRGDVATAVSGVPEPTTGAPASVAGPDAPSGDGRSDLSTSGVEFPTPDQESNNPVGKTASLPNNPRLTAIESQMAPAIDRVSKINTLLKSSENPDLSTASIQNATGRSFAKLSDEHLSAKEQARYREIAGKTNGTPEPTKPAPKTAAVDPVKNLQKYVEDNDLKSVVAKEAARRFTQSQPAGTPFDRDAFRAFAKENLTHITQDVVEQHIAATAPAAATKPDEVREMLGEGTLHAGNRQELGIARRSEADRTEIAGFRKQVVSKEGRKLAAQIANKHLPEWKAALAEGGDSQFSAKTFENLPARLRNALTKTLNEKPSSPEASETSQWTVVPQSVESAQTPETTAASPASGNQERVEVNPNRAVQDLKQAKTGVPLDTTLYNGSGRTDATSAYNPDGVSQEPVLGKGTYGTPNREFAESFGPNVKGIKVHLDNPLVISNDNQWSALIKKAGWEFANPTRFGTTPEDIAQKAAKTSQEIANLRSLVERMGHDGMVIHIPSMAEAGDAGKTLSNVFGASQVVQFKAPETQESAVVESSKEPPAEAPTTKTEGITPRDTTPPSGPSGPTDNPFVVAKKAVDTLREEFPDAARWVQPMLETAIRSHVKDADQAAAFQAGIERLTEGLREQDIFAMKKAMDAVRPSIRGGDAPYSPEELEAINSSAAYARIKKLNSLSPLELSDQKEAVWSDTLRQLVEDSHDPDLAAALQQLKASVPRTNSATNGLLDLFRNTQEKQDANSFRMIARRNAGRTNRNAMVLQDQLRAFGELTDNLSRPESLRFIARMESGEAQVHDILQALDPRTLGKWMNKYKEVSLPSPDDVAGELRRLLDLSKDNVNRASGALENFYTDYMPHIFEDFGKAQNFAKQWVAQHPLEGNTDYLRQRHYAFLEDAVRAGHMPLTFNPVKLSLMRMEQMGRFAMAHDIRNEMTSYQLAQQYKPGTQPRGWVPLEDKIFKVRQYSPEAGGMVDRGQFYAPERVAKDFNNFVSTGLRGKWKIKYLNNASLYDGLRGWGGLANRFQLSLSMLHGMESLVNTNASELGGALLKLANQGDVSGAVKGIFSWASILHPIIRNVKYGDHILANLKDPSKQVNFASTAHDAEAAGFRTNLDPFLETHQAQMLKNNWQRATSDMPITDRAKAALKLPFNAAGAAIEKSSWPIMNWFIPRVKLGAFKMEADRIHQQFEGESPDVIDQELQKAWDSMDNRFGEVVYDNLFMHRAMKDSMMLAMRSPGWNIGTARELGGGAIDAGKSLANVVQGKKMQLSTRTGYTLGLIATVAYMNAMYQYMHTGQTPKGVDYFYPQDGTKNRDGEPNRVFLKSYINDTIGFYQNPALTLWHKAAPEFSTLADITRNANYYNREIVDPAWGPIHKLGAIALYSTQNSGEPFTLSNYAERELRASGNKTDAAFESQLGYLPAPNWVSQTPAEKLAATYYNEENPQGIKDEEEFDQKKSFVKMRNQALAGKLKGTDVEKAIDAGDLKPSQLPYLFRNPTQSSLEFRAHRLSISRGMQLWSAANPAEKQKLLPILAGKLNTVGPKQQLIYAQELGLKH